MTTTHGGVGPGGTAPVEELQPPVAKDQPHGLTARLLDMARSEAHELEALVAWMG